MGLKGRGGAGRGQGRKPKDVEDKIKTLSITALKNIFGSEQGAINHIAENAAQGGKDGFPYMKLLLEYGYGKPKETINATIEQIPIVNMNEWK